MIWTFLLSFIVDVIDVFLSWLPEVTTLPLGMDEALTTAIGYVNSIREILPFLDLMFTAFAWYLAFLVILLLLRLLRIIR